MKWFPPISGCLILACALAGHLQAAIPDYVNPFLPAMRGDGRATLLRGCERAIADGDYPAAAAALEELLKSDELFGDAESGWISARAWWAALPAEQRDEVSAAWRERFENSARTALALLRENPVAAPEEFIALAHRFAPSAAAGDALLIAAERALALGDAPAAGSLLAAAQRAGMTLDDAAQQHLAACGKIAAAGGRTYRGPVPVALPWFWRSDQAHHPRYLPLAVDGRVYLTGARDLLAIEPERNSTIWAWSADNRALRPLERRRERGRGLLFSSAILYGDRSAEIILARQRRPDSHDFCIRAFRARDGRLLWSSETDPRLARISIASAPAIAGRFAYCIAKDYAQPPGAIQVIALNLLDGNLHWQTTLGSAAPQGSRPLRSRRDEEEDGSGGWDDFWEQTAPAVHEDWLIVSPNVGFTFALDRFDGRIRWARRYLPDRFFAPNDQRKLLPPPEPLEVFRWGNTPCIISAVAIIAPQDIPGVMGLDLATGRQLWRHDEDCAGLTLIGSAGGLAILAGDVIEALDAATGKQRWQYEPPGQRSITGPAALVGDTIYIPEAEQLLITLSAADGKPAKAPPKPPSPPSLVRLAERESFKEALNRAELARAFIPAASEAAEITRRRLVSGNSPQHVIDALKRFAPDWTIVDCGKEMEPGVKDEFRGKKNVFVTHPLNLSTPARLQRMVRIEPGKKTFLKLTVTHHPQGDWQLIVKATGKELYNRPINGQTARDNQWHRHQIDLTPFAGRTIRLELINQPTGWNHEAAYWAEIALESR